MRVLVVPGALGTNSGEGELGTPMTAAEIRSGKSAGIDEDTIINNTRHSKLSLHGMWPGATLRVPLSDTFCVRWAMSEEDWKARMCFELAQTRRKELRWPT